MNIIVENLARISINNIFYYNLKFSLKVAVKTENDIRFYFDQIVAFPYIGTIIQKVKDK